MKSPIRLPLQLTAASTLVLSAAGALAEEGTLYAPLAIQSPPAATGMLRDADGVVQLGLGYASDDSFMFGQYNGLHKEGTTVIGNLQWQDFSAGDSYWQVSVSDLGLDTREGIATWGRPDRLKISVGFDSQLQVRNDSGRTPFRGGSNLVLPDDWVSGSNTADWSALDTSLRRFDRELERDKLFAELDARLSDSWKLDTRIAYEDRQGTADVAGAIYPDLASGDSVLLPQPVDYSTTEFDIGISYTGRDVQLEGRVGYSDFDNDDDVLTWQNPYSTYGPAVGYPGGIGGLGVAPDSEQINGRLTGQVIFNPTARLQFDGSYAVTEQDQNYLDYTVNPNLAVAEPPPRTNFDGEVATGGFGARLLLRPLPKFNLEGFFRSRFRDYDTPRDGYRYVRGDATNQPRSALTAYNTAHDFRSETMGLEGRYRLPWRSRLRVEYAYERVERENAAVEETEEDRITVGYRIQPWDNFTANAELLYGDRVADTYHWDQSYYALLDAELINATPDSQRYITHPDLSQYYLSNREQWEGKIDLNYLPFERWNLALNLLWHEDDYDKSELGLTDAKWQRVNLSATYTASQNLNATVYAGYDTYESEQSSRAFRGGQEKNAFEIYPPLPQASDPGRNWDLDAEDNSFTLGANVAWQIAKTLSLELDYSYVDTTAEQDLTTYSSTLSASDLPDVETTLHHLVAGGTWDMGENLSLRLDYQYYRYKSDDWARQGVQPATIGKVLTFGESNPNEQIHYVGASVLYRWQ